MHNQWSKRVCVLDNGRAPLDTKGVDNSSRPFVVECEVWLFADIVRRAQASDHLYSLIETEKRRGLDPFACLCVVFRKLPRATTLDEIEVLLPYNIYAKGQPALIASGDHR